VKKVEVAHVAGFLSKLLIELKKGSCLKGRNPFYLDKDYEKKVMALPVGVFLYFLLCLSS